MAFPEPILQVTFEEKSGSGRDHLVPLVFQVSPIWEALGKIPIPQQGLEHPLPKAGNPSHVENAQKLFVELLMAVLFPP